MRKAPLRIMPCMRHPLLLLLLCVLSWFLETTLVFKTASAELLHTAANSSFSTDQPSAFWLSQNGDCTFGFKKTSPNAYLLSVWFTKDPSQTPLWWPVLRNHSPNPAVKGGAVFLVTEEGSLELWADDGRGRNAVVWSEVGGIGKGGFAEVRDTCNLVVLDMEGKGLLWQSFADNRNSLMLPSYGKGSVQDKGLVLDKPYLLQSKDSLHSYAAGRFHVASDHLQNLYLYAALDQHYQYNPGTTPNSDFTYMYATMNITGDFRIHEDHGKAFVSNRSMAAVNRLTLGEDGNLRIYSWESNAWREIWRMIDDRCKLASPCGPFAICMDAGGPSISCTCPPGYKKAEQLAMKASSKASMKDAVQGCGSNMNSMDSCGTEDDMKNGNFSMLEVADSDYYYNDLKGYIPGLSIEECKNLCLRECKCVAASHSSTDNHCTLKGNTETGLLMNGYANNGTTLLVKVKASPPHNTTSRRLRTLRKGLAVFCGSMVIVLLAATVGCMKLFRGRSTGRRGSSVDTELNFTGDQDAGPKSFTYKELVEATRRFSVVLGEGAFGKVYKGWINADKDLIIRSEGNDGCELHSDHQDAAAAAADREHKGEKRIKIKDAYKPKPQVAVAVKVLKGFGFDGCDDFNNQAANQKHLDEGERHFKAEVSTLGRIHHINLVSLIGYCVTRGHAKAQDQKRMLVYEHMDNGSLDKFLTMPTSLQEDHLPWPRRYSIALDTARGIAYLHHDCNPPILHCDIKPQNVLLNHDFSAKVADFGFACPLKQRQSHLTVTGLRGTRGYMAPEWVTSVEVTSKVDVYSYGMLLLELIHAGELVDKATGLIVDRSTLLHWALQSLSSGVGTHSTRHPEALENTSMDKSIEVHKDHIVSETSDRFCTEGIEKLRLIKIGLWCVQFMPSMRPSMSCVV